MYICIYVLNTGSRPQCVPAHRFSSWAEMSLGTIGIETTLILSLNQKIIWPLWPFALPFSA